MTEPEINQQNKLPKASGTTNEPRGKRGLIWAERIMGRTECGDIAGAKCEGPSFVSFKNIESCQDWTTCVTFCH